MDNRKYLRERNLAFKKDIEELLNSELNINSEIASKLSTMITAYHVKYDTDYCEFVFKELQKLVKESEG